MSKLPSIALVVLATVLGWSKSLRADPMSQLAIQWDAPDECPSRSALVSELRRDLEGSQVPSVRLAVTAHVEHPQPDVWQVTIATDSVEGISDRVVKSRSCQALLEATSLIVAMMIDPETAASHAHFNDGDAEGHEPAANPDRATNETPSGFVALPVPATLLDHGQSLPPPSASSALAAQRNVASPMTGAIAASTAFDVGSLPGITGAFRGSLGLLYGPWRLEVLFGYWLPKNHITDLRGVGGEFRKASLLGRACAHLWNSPAFRTGPCVGVGAARLSGTANQVLQYPGSATRIRAEPDVGVIALVNVTSLLALRFDLDVAAPLNRPKFGYTNGTTQVTLYETPPASFRAGLGLELGFGN